MKRWWWMLMLLAALVVGLIAAASGQPHPLARYRDSKLVTGEWGYNFATYERPILVLADQGPITGFAFGPGRAEVAYCAPVGRQGQWGLWVVAASPPPPETQEYPFTKTGAARRLLWTAPEGVTLRGPVWWAPDGSSVAVRADTEKSSDLVAVDYGSGEAVSLCREMRVVNLVWHPRGKRIAYVTEEDGNQAVWIQSVPSGEARRLGDSGCDLRWSLDGSSLKWLSPAADEHWTEMSWQAEDGQIVPGGPRPARPEDAFWSPDGALCATLASTEGGGGEELVIYPRAGATGERVPVLPVPQRLLGWSPDSRLLLVLGERDIPVAVAPRPVPEGIRPIAELRRGYSSGRASIAGPPVDPQAGPPSWSSGCDLLAYVVAEPLNSRRGAQKTEYPQGCLVAAPISREHLEPTTRAKEEPERVLYNMKNVALALQMYFADNHDIFPPSGETDEVWRILDPYVRNRDVFMKPGTEDEMVSRYLVPPGLRLVDIHDPVGMPIAVVDYHPDFFVIAYGDGHVKMFEKEGEYWEKWEAWWREYWERREREEP
jgi:hypothetical protein